MPDEACKALSNGVWLCDICARMVDDDEIAFLPATLKKWRTDAEAYVAELVTQDSRLRQLRGILMNLLSAIRILNAMPGPGPAFDQTFRDAGDIPLGRTFLEAELVLFENGFIEEANALQRIGHELVVGVQPIIGRQAPNAYSDISDWKNAAVRTLMINVLRFSEGSYARYLEIESSLVSSRRTEILQRGTFNITKLTLPTEGLAQASLHWKPAAPRATQGS